MQKIIILFSILMIGLLNPAVSNSQLLNKKSSAKGPSLQWKIRLDDSSIEKIILHPEDLIAHPEEFWASDSAYQLVKLWQKKMNFPIPMEKWTQLVEPFKNFTVKKRDMNPQLVASRLMKKYEKEFNNNAVPYLYTFLPRDLPKINTTIYFTTAIIYPAFQIGNNLVVFGPNADKDNFLIRELFHIGFEKCKPVAHFNGVKDSTLNQIYNDLQKEGIATYAGFKGLTLFPKFDPDTNKDDYGFLKNGEKVYKLHEELNDLLKNFPSLIEKEVGKRVLKYNISKVGVVERAFFVLGCFMAMKIDEKLGRDALVGTISKGPESFIKAYNSVVDKKFQIIDLYSKN